MNRPDRGLILATAFTQTVGWGTLYIPFALLLGVGPLFRWRRQDLGELKGKVMLALVLSRAAALTIALETDYDPRDVEALADVVHEVANVGEGVCRLLLVQGPGQYDFLPA